MAKKKTANSAKSKGKAKAIASRIGAQIGGGGKK